MLWSLCHINIGSYYPKKSFTTPWHFLKATLKRFPTSKYISERELPPPSDPLKDSVHLPLFTVTKTSSALLWLGEKNTSCVKKMFIGQLDSH